MPLAGGIHAIECLRKSAKEHEKQILNLKTSPSMEVIRNDPRYVALEKKVGLN
jgi:hypothetical protein